MCRPFIAGLQWLIDLAFLVSFVIFQTVACIVLFVSISLLVRSFVLLVSRNNRIKSTPNKAILITGATSGFGLALSKFYHRLGFTIFACYYNDREPGYRELSKLNEDTGLIYLIDMDISLSDSVQRARKNIDCILAKNPQLRLYCLVNNAGLAPAAIHLTMESRNTIERICDVNLRGQLLTIREFMPLLIRGQGRIVNVSSGLALATMKLTALYSSTKVGICQMSRCIQNETEHFGVKTIVVLPGNAIKNTNIISNVKNDLRRAWEEFDEDEKLIYERLFKRYEQISTSELDQLKRMKKGDISVRLNESSRSFENSFTYFNKLFKNANIMGRYILPFVESLSGTTNSANKLEDDSFLEAFDDAIRSVNPQSVLFPGNRWYQFLSGPICRWLPDPVVDYVMSCGKPQKERYLNDLIS